jgi:hypothetical protein
LLLVGGVVAALHFGSKWFGLRGKGLGK